MSVNMTVVAPIPRAEISSVMTANPGFWRKLRSAYRVSWSNSSAQRVPRASRQCCFTCSGPPSAIRASRCACAAEWPRAIRSLSCWSRWNRSSFSSSLFHTVPAP